MARKPWTVKLGYLADHAVPLGAAINRWLRRWSPWHLRYDRDECEKRCARMMAEMREHQSQKWKAREARDQMYKVLQANHCTLHQFFGEVPSYSSGSGVVYDRYLGFRRYSVDFTPPRVTWAYMHEPWLTEAVKSDYLVEHLERHIHDSFRPIAKLAAKQIVDAIKQNGVR